VSNNADEFTAFDTETDILEYGLAQAALRIRIDLGQMLDRKERGHRHSS
jgi:hypothetical protein